MKKEIREWNIWYKLCLIIVPLFLLTQGGFSEALGGLLGILAVGLCAKKWGMPSWILKKK